MSLSSLSLLMKGEHRTPGGQWRGIPAQGVPEIAAPDVSRFHRFPRQGVQLPMNTELLACDSAHLRINWQTEVRPDPAAAEDWFAEPLLAVDRRGVGRGVDLVDAAMRS